MSRWRVRTPQALQRRVAAIEATGLGRGWINGDLGHGRAYQFETPEGHRMELFWEVDYVTPPAGKETLLRNRPQKRPASGIPVRRIDHVNLLAAKREGVRDFLVDILGFRERERVVEEDGSILASFLSVTNLSHDIAMVPEPTDMRGRLHHVCFHYTSVQHLFDVAELAKEAGLMVETGPGRHGIGGATFVYILEPGGNRIELMGDPGYMIFDPAWRTVVWKGIGVSQMRPSGLVRRRRTRSLLTGPHPPRSERLFRQRSHSCRHDHELRLSQATVSPSMPGTTCYRRYAPGRPYVSAPTTSAL